MDVIEIYSKDPKSLYNDRFFRKRTKGKTIRWEIMFGECLRETFQIESIVDFGCGLGTFLDGCLKSGAKKVMGFEYGYELAKKYISPTVASFIQYGNVMEKIDCGKFDCAMSIEVAEHILPDKSDMFIQNLVDAGDKYIILTAAHPGQGGLWHINERPKQFWGDSIEKCGFKYTQNDTTKFLKAIKSKRIKIPRHIRYNLMVFKKGDKNGTQI